MSSKFLSLLVVSFVWGLFPTIQAKPLRVGDTVSEFSVSGGPQRPPVSFSKLKGKVILLNFWATWCPPCVQEMPSMDELNRRLKAKPFMVVGISVDERWEDLDAFFNKLNRPPTFLIAHDPERKVTLGLFGVDKYPESFLIDKKGKIRAYYQGAADWTSPSIFSEISAILNEK